MIVATDLLTGVLVGFGLSIAFLAVKAAQLKVSLSYREDQPDQADLRLVGAATFLRVPQLTKVLEQVKPGTTLHVPLDRVSYIDHACMELLEDWGRTQASNGMRLVIEPKALERRLEGQAPAGQPVMSTQTSA